MGFQSSVLSTVALRDGIKVSGSIFTNPADATVLTTTGPLIFGNYLLAFIISASVASVVDIQHRDAAGTANVDVPIRIRIGANTNEYIIYPNEVHIVADEAFRPVLVGAIVGDIQATIFYLPVA